MSSSLLRTGQPTVPEADTYVIPRLPNAYADSDSSVSPHQYLENETHSLEDTQCSRTNELFSENSVPSGFSSTNLVIGEDSRISYLSDEAVTPSESYLPSDNRFLENLDSRLPMSLMDATETASFMLLQNAAAEPNLSTPTFGPPVSFVLEPEDSFSFLELESIYCPRTECPSGHTCHQSDLDPIQNFTSNIIPAHSASTLPVVASDNRSEYFPTPSCLLGTQSLDVSSFDAACSANEYMCCSSTRFDSEPPSNVYVQEAPHTNFFPCSTESRAIATVDNFSVAHQVDSKSYSSFPVHGSNPETIMCDQTVYYTHLAPSEPVYYNQLPASNADHYQYDCYHFPMDSLPVPVSETEPVFHYNNTVHEAQALHASPTYKDYTVNGCPNSTCFDVSASHVSFSYQLDSNHCSDSYPAAHGAYYAYQLPPDSSLHIYNGASNISWPAASTAVSTRFPDTQQYSFNVLSSDPLLNTALHETVYSHREATQTNSLPVAPRYSETDCPKLPSCIYPPASAANSKNFDLFRCPHCSRLFSRPSHLDLHIRVHTGERPHECCLCGRSFTQASNLRRHLSSHKTWPPVTSNSRCTTGASEQLVSHNVVARHKRSYGRFKSWCCRFCNQHLESYLQLRQHMVYHKDSRVYACVFESCLNTFTSPEALLRHVIDAHRSAYTLDHSCQYCGRIFPSIRHFIQHWLPRRRGLPPRCGPTPGKSTHEGHTSTDPQHPACKVIGPKGSNLLKRRIRMLSLNSLRKDRPVRSFRCPVCTVRCCSLARLRHHLVRVHGDVITSATHCSSKALPSTSLSNGRVVPTTSESTAPHSSKNASAAEAGPLRSKTVLFLLHVEEQEEEKKEEDGHHGATKTKRNDHRRPLSDDITSVDSLCLCCEHCGRRFQKNKFFDDHRQLCQQKIQERLRRSRLRSHRRVGFKVPVDSSSPPSSPKPTSAEYNCPSQSNGSETDGLRRSSRKRTIIKTWKPKNTRLTTSAIRPSASTNHNNVVTTLT